MIMKQTEDRATVDALRRFVVECTELRELERSLGRFSLFDVLRSTHSELRHSNMLAWLLDPTGSHGLDDLFLRRWLMLVLNEADMEDLPLDPVEVDTEPVARVEVRREWNYIDVLVNIRLKSGTEWVVAIENKVNARQSKGQLKRYRELIQQSYPHSRHIFIFLTKNEEVPEDQEKEHYVSARYETVKRTLDLCLSEGQDSMGHGPRYLIEQYNHLINERFMANSKERELALKIYQEHRKALDYIFEQIPDKLNEVGALVSKAVKDAGHWTRSNKPVVFLPVEWRIPNNMAPNDWPKVCLEIRLTEEKVVLAAQARQELKDPEWRQKLFLLAKQENWLGHNASKPGPIWFTFFNQPLTQIPFNGSPDEIASEIFAKTKEALNDVRVKGMVQKVAGLMGELDGVSMEE